jgi:ribosomal protein S18 acetylase RimI-like enzyme
MSPHIRPLLPDDYDALWQLFLVAFPVKYKNEFLDAWLARAPDFSLGAFSTTGQMLGFIVTKLAPSTVHIEFLGVHPDAQKGGIGTLLLSTSLDACRRLGLQAKLVPVNEPRIIGWYKKHGFRESAEPASISPYTGDIEKKLVWTNGLVSE